MKPREALQPSRVGSAHSLNILFDRVKYDGRRG